MLLAFRSVTCWRTARCGSSPCSVAVCSLGLSLPPFETSYPQRIWTGSQSHLDYSSESIITILEESVRDHFFWLRFAPENDQKRHSSFQVLVMTLSRYGYIIFPHVKLDRKPTLRLFLFLYVTSAHLRAR